MKIGSLIILSVCCIVISSCRETLEVVSEVEAEVESNVEEPKGPRSVSIDVTYLDKSTLPQDDFFQFSNGTWIENNPVPPSESRWGSFNELEKTNNEKLTIILDEAMNSKAMVGTTQQLLGAYYASFINMDSRNEAGFDAIKDNLSLVSNINSKKDLATAISKQHKVGINSLFSFGVDQDLMIVIF